MKALLAALGLLLLPVFAEAQEFRPHPVGQQFAVPVRPYAVYQAYQVAPVQYAPYVQRYRPPCPHGRCPYYRPRGVWGIGPFVLGYY